MPSGPYAPTTRWLGSPVPSQSDAPASAPPVKAAGNADKPWQAGHRPEEPARPEPSSPSTPGPFTAARAWALLREMTGAR